MSWRRGEKDLSAASRLWPRKSAEDREGRKVVVDRLHVLQGSRDNPVRLDVVEDLVYQAHKTYAGARVIADPWQSIGLCQRLRGKGVPITEFNFTAASVGKIATSLHLALRNRALALPNDERLIDELANVRLKETTPGVYRLDHDADSHDDMAVALGLCVQHLLDREEAIPAAISWSLLRDDDSPSLRERAPASVDEPMSWPSTW